LARSKRSDAASDSVVVIGLGRFGSSVAVSLLRLGHEVLAIDEDATFAQRWSDELTHVVAVDSTDEEALKQLGAGGFSRAVVGIGNNIEASVLPVLALAELGIKEIWAKAISRKHGQILHRVGANHVVDPETATGSPSPGRSRRPRRTADAGGVAAADQGRRHRGRREAPGRGLHLRPSETEVHAGDELIVSGSTQQVEKFSARTLD
jgi:trk system potassium uptake protein TrkA